MYAGPSVIRKNFSSLLLMYSPPPPLTAGLCHCLYLSDLTVRQLIQLITVSPIYNFEMCKRIYITAKFKVKQIYFGMWKVQTIIMYRQITNFYNNIMKKVHLKLVHTAWWWGPVKNFVHNSSKRPDESNDEVINNKLKPSVKAKIQESKHFKTNG